MKTLFRCICWLSLITIVAILPVEAVVLKIATLSPEGSYWMDQMRRGALEVKQKTEGRVRIKYYPGGIMGNEKAVLRKIRIGQLQGAAIMYGSLSGIHPDGQIYGLPMLFESFEEIDYVRQRMDPILLEGLAKRGFIAFGLVETGFAFVMSRQPVVSIDDLRRQKVWLPDADSSALELLQRIDVSPIPLPIADVRAALQTGMIDTVATAPMAAIALQWHTQVDYLTDTPVAYIYGVLVISQKAYQQIPTTDQTILTEVMGRISRIVDRHARLDNMNAMAALKKQGIQFVAPDINSFAEWKKEAGKIAMHFVHKGKLRPDILAMLQSHLETYRLADN